MPATERMELRFQSGTTVLRLRLEDLLNNFYKVLIDFRLEMVYNRPDRDFLSGFSIFIYRVKVRQVPEKGRT